MIPFRFDPDGHRYLVENRQVPNITTMLETTGWVDSTWYTEEGRRRGTAVHRLTTDYDLGALELATCTSEFKHYLLHYADAVRIVRPAWQHVEVPFVHEQFRFGGRPDRVGRVFGALAVVEIKSGAPEKSHGVQLALQAYLVAPVLGLPPELLQRYVFYAGPKKCKVDELVNRRDFAEARKVIRTCCGI